MQPRQRPSVGRTWEVGLWVVVVLVALLMRFAQLDGAPLSADEAAGATAAWRAARGRGLPLTDYNPFLLAANSLLFTLFGASDGMARLWPALFGSFLALTPVFWRRSLGRMGALAAGAYLALSPTVLVASRQVGGTTISALGAMVFVGGVIRFLEGDRPRWLTVAAIGLGLGVSSGAAVYGLLLPLGLAWGLVAQAWPEARASLLRGPLSQLRPYVGSLFAVFGGAVLALSTGLGWNLPGMGSVGGHLAAWWGRFGGTSSVSASPLMLLVVYELLGISFAIGGIVVGVLRRRRTAVLLGIWVGLGFLLMGVMPGRRPTDLVWVVVPLALLAGVGMEELFGARRFGGALQLTYGCLVLVLWGHCYLMVARYAAFGDRADLALALVTLVVQALLGLSFGLILGADHTLRTAAAATGLVLLAVTLAAGWGVAYQRPTDPREVLLREPTAVNIRDLVETLRELSWQETGMPTTLRFTVVAPQDSALAWYLRDFRMARRFEHPGGLAGDEIGPIVVTSGRDEGLVASSGRAYAGQDFPLSRRWTPRELDCRLGSGGCRTAVDWFLFRDGVPLPEAHQWAALWRVSDLSNSQ